MNDPTLDKRKCPNCGKHNINKIATKNKNSSFVLSEINISEVPLSNNPINAIPVDLYGCHDCKYIFLKCENL